MAEKMILRKLLCSLTFERQGKRITFAPNTVEQFTPDEVAKLNQMNPDLLEYPSDDEVELYQLRLAKKAPAVLPQDLGTDDGPATTTKQKAPAKKKGPGTQTANAADEPATHAADGEGNAKGDNDEI